MNFEVNGQSYILAFLPGEGSFALFENDEEEGVKRLKIVHDDGPLFIAKVGAGEDPEKPTVLN